MKLKEFRVQNYKKVRDTGWVSVKDLTVRNVSSILGHSGFAISV